MSSSSSKKSKMSSRKRRDSIRAIDLDFRILKEEVVVVAGRVALILIDKAQ
ncbi:MAG: hypothetical protein ACJ71P_05520 [Nitrososphaeraceae archaeon]